MKKNTLNNTILWDISTEERMKKIPAFVASKVRESIEKEALALGESIIKNELLDKLMAKMMPSMNHGKTKKQKIDNFYALINKEPINAGFKDKNRGPHAMMENSKSVIDPSKVWPEVSMQVDTSVSRALYIHIPFCLSRCKFCSFYHSQTEEGAISAYVNDLMKELEMVAESTYARSLPFNAVYFGGGTPTDLSPKDLKRIMTHLNNNWNLANDCEITLEGRLYGFNDDKVDACLENGINRFSFGLQSFNTKIRRMMGRIEKREVLFQRLGEILKTNGVNVSADLIYGFPEQTNEIWMDDLQSIIESGVDSASIYRLKQMPNSPIQEMVDKGKLSPPASLEDQAKQFTLSNEFFRSMNAKRAGVTHWSFTNRERCIYNSISAYGGSVLPVGCGAGGNLGKYRLMQGMSLQEYSGYIARGEKPVGMMVSENRSNKALGMLNGELHLNLGVNLKELSRKTGTMGLNEVFSPLFKQWDKAGMVTYNNKTGLMCLTDAGVFHAPTIQQKILDYYKWKTEEK